MRTRGPYEERTIGGITIIKCTHRITIKFHGFATAANSREFTWRTTVPSRRNPFLLLA